jgi:hypothetical protein
VSLAMITRYGPFYAVFVLEIGESIKSKCCC